MKSSPLSLFVAATTVVVLVAGCAGSEPLSGRSLRESRAEIDAGTSAGVTLYKSPATADGAATPAAAGTAPAAPAGTAPAAPRGLVNEPLSQQPMSTSKRLETAQGIPLPTAASKASEAASVPGKGR